jgi:hypothetical protein
MRDNPLLPRREKGVSISPAGRWIFPYLRREKSQGRGRYSVKIVDPAIMFGFAIALSKMLTPLH